jgi:hypothetical protein
MKGNTQISLEHYLCSITITYTDLVAERKLQKQEKENLKKKMDEKKISFDDLKKGCISKYKNEVTDPESWKSVADISKLDCFTLLGKLEKKI